MEINESSCGYIIQIFREEFNNFHLTFRFRDLGCRTMMARSFLYIPSVTIQKCRVNVVSLSPEALRPHAYLFARENISELFSLAINKHRTEESIHITKLVLNLGVIPKGHFSTLFNQRLTQALEQCMEQLATQAHTQNTRLAHATPAELLAYVESNPEALTPLAICCMQQATLLHLLHNGPPQYLRVLLKQLLQGEDKHSSVLVDTCYSRVTASRLGIAALGYLRHQAQGNDWLSQHSPTVSQMTGWAKAIAQGEIPPEQLAQLLTGNRPSNSILPEQRAYSPLVVMRWLLPLWRQPAVRKVIHRLKGGRGVQRLDAYLSRCLQRQDDDAMRKGKGMHIAPQQVGLPRDNVTLPESEEEHTVRDHATLPQGKERPSDPKRLALPRDNATLPGSEEMPTTSRCTMQPRKGGLHSTDEPRSSSLGISNAGLLLLWPLLPQLFSQLGLWEEERFISDAARWQAVYGLDRLVWGEPNPTDERLTLNQVLCGASFSATVPPTAQLSLVQQQQIDDWLTAIGQQLVGWQKLSLTDIRQLFLQRAGEISTEGIFPQISVRPEPYDFLLRDWPWPMTLASFPWTEQPLTIVWPLNGLTG
uniref:contractile injection system tape measure protein n=1 Tax=Serratia proteamaculans TaxID=28151 RepID=UPI001F4C455D|nr:contractile injection system tape measure protein [Serratia proteamaculans]